MSSNLSGFAYKFSPVDQFLCSLFKRQRRRFLPVKLCTVYSFSKMYFLTHV